MNFVETEYKNLLSHSKTRFLSLFPAVERVLTLFAALKSYFISQEKTPKIIENFFRSDFSEIYLFFFHSFMSIFHEKIARIEKESNSVLEVLEIIDQVIKTLSERYSNRFLSLNVKTAFAKIRKEGQDKECDNFGEQLWIFIKKLKNI